MNNVPAEHPNTFFLQSSMQIRVPVATRQRSPQYMSYSPGTSSFSSYGSQGAPMSAGRRYSPTCPRSSAGLLQISHARYIIWRPLQTTTYICVLIFWSLFKACSYYWIIKDFALWSNFSLTTMSCQVNLYSLNFFSLCLHGGNNLSRGNLTRDSSCSDSWECNRRQNVDQAITNYL